MLVIDFDEKVFLLQDFTSDRSKLLATIETLLVGEDENAPVDPNLDGAWYVFLTESD